ncbi:MAG: Verru_Chthon cassette protein C [Chthoniobacter sp.]|nr:Verru_Chthon cassette protein C [Chthoniobacter sp.]
MILLICLLLVSMTNATSATWRQTTGRVEQFRSANNGYEAITRRLSQATLNTYWDYDNPTSPKKYFRQSDLRFLSGNMTAGTKKLLTTVKPRRPTHGIFFQAPLGFVDDATNFSGLDNLINTWGYYVEFNYDARPAFIESLSAASKPANRWRYRMMELMQPSNALSIFSFTSGNPAYVGKEWFSTKLPAATLPPAALPVTPTHVLAENIVALVVHPRLTKKEEELTGKTLSKDYFYDSTVTNTDPDINPKSQLPPIVQVTMVAIDEQSAARTANGDKVPAFDVLLDTLFQDTTKFDADLTSLQTALAAQRLNFRVFTSSVSIRGAKWSRK